METTKSQEKQVTEQVSELQAGLQVLSDEISNLRNRLAPILKERQLEAGKDKEPIAVLVPLASTIRDCVREANIHGLQIAEIINLLEI